jgi:hypothetical protein
VVQSEFARKYCHSLKFDVDVVVPWAPYYIYIPEEEAFFDAVMYTDFSDVVDNVIDNLHLAVVSNVYDLNLTNDAQVSKPDFAFIC